MGVACDTAVWWGDGSVGPAREGLAALSRGSSTVIGIRMAIRSFTTQDKGDTENSFWGELVSRKCPWQAVYESARDALIYLHAARDLKALRAVPGFCVIKTAQRKICPTPGSARLGIDTSTTSRWRIFSELGNSKHTQKDLYKQKNQLLNLIQSPRS